MPDLENAAALDCGCGAASATRWYGSHVLADRTGEREVEGTRMRTVRLRVGLCAVLVFFVAAAPVVVSAQSQERSKQTASLLRVLLELESGSKLRIRLNQGLLYEGTLVTADRRALILTPDLSALQTFSPGQIEALWVRSGNNQTTGMKMGLFLGGVVSGFVLTALVSSDASNPAGPFVIGFLPGALIGGTIGTLIGRTQPRWTQRFPSTAR